MICSGPRRGKQLTYALLEERVPAGRASPVGPALNDRDGALAELARRYFTSHGPATLKDFVWWSGLTVRDARAGIDLAGSALMRDEVDGFTYWSADRRTPKALASPAAHLLPNYDEYLIAHKDRDLVRRPRFWQRRHAHQGSVRAPPRHRRPPGGELDANGEGRIGRRGVCDVRPAECGGRARDRRGDRAPRPLPETPGYFFLLGSPELGEAGGGS